MNPEGNLAQCLFRHVEPYKEAAAEEGVSIRDTKDTYWFRWRVAKTDVGFCALMRVRKKRARIKSVYVLPLYRLELRKVMVEELTQIARLLDFTSIEMCVPTPERYGDGWRHTGSRAGFWWVEMDL
jgi:hypothetical protein